MQPDTLTDQNRTAAPVEDRYLTRQEAADFLGVSRKLVDFWRWQKEGPPYIKFKSNVRYKVSDLVAWMDAQRVYPSSGKAA